jgi:hypothetical protein
VTMGVHAEAATVHAFWGSFDLEVPLTRPQP